ncbi:MAG: tRNA (adenosine(37)-N6)-threonylcarbamoyltransferase complex ATPase subunit type 1 TsaE [Clostridia bacterium]|nr:tRNA (adenosine(37)-N6)-threonylcarbamoyltransferase complex ATPase subunit type 1 TsaE [Clostridia bacterium]
MNYFNFTSHSESETMNFASNLASKLHCGDIIILSGDLGSGKTKFTEGFLKNFNLQNEISSPTFTIVNEYKNIDVNIYHFDIYRLEDIDEFYAIGGEEYFSSGICLIEWGELISEILPPEYIKISFEKDENLDNIRYLKVETFGNKFDNIFSD